MGWTHSCVAQVAECDHGKKKDNKWFSTRVQTGWKGCIDYGKMKALTWKDHFPPLFFDQFIKWLAGYPYFCVLGCYFSYDHYPFDPSNPEHTIITVTFDVFAFSLSKVIWIMQHT